MIGSLSLDQLRVLTTIADAGSFSAAGRALGRAQSAISQIVASLEGAQGVSSFDRSSHRPRLTTTSATCWSRRRGWCSRAQPASRRSPPTPVPVSSLRLALAIDPLVPTAPLIDSLRALGSAFPDLPVSFSTEGLGGSLRRLRSGSAALAICLLLPDVPDDIAAFPLLRIRLRAVCAPGHPLAGLKRPATRDDLAPHVQLVLSDPVEPGGPNYGLSSARLWRFVDLARRLDFLLAGFGWGRMPEHLVADAIARGRLVWLDVEDDPTPQDGLPIYAAHRRDRLLGTAGRWLLNDLRQRLVSA